MNKQDKKVGKSGIFRWIRTFYLMLKYRHTIIKVGKMIADPKSVFSRAISENLTLEEMEGMTDVERVYRLLSMHPKELKKDLAHLKKCLDI